MTIAQRLKSLNAAVAKGLIVRDQWRSETSNYVSLLAAFGPDIDTYHDIPLKLMPQWLAKLTPQINNQCSLAVHLSVIEHYAELANRWRILGDNEWNSVYLKFLNSVFERFESLNPQNRMHIVREIISVTDALLEATKLMTAQEKFKAWDHLINDLFLAIEEELNVFK